MAPETEARNQLMSLLNAEFAPEALTAEDDKLHASLGWEGPRIGVYPDQSETMMSNNFVRDTTIVVQFYAQYDKQIDPEQSVSPSLIEGYADRFRNKLRGGDVNTAANWYFKLSRILFPDDPTGNKTRFEAWVVARGNNGSQIVETGP